MFASATFTEHLGRGLIAVAALAGAVILGRQAGPASIGSAILAIGALVALRGCPICWTTGLLEMIAARRTRR